MTDNVPAIVRYDGDDGVQERFEHGRHVLLQPVALFGCESALPHKTKLKERHLLFVVLGLRREKKKTKRRKEIGEIGEEFLLSKTVVVSKKERGEKYILTP